MSTCRYPSCNKPLLPNEALCREHKHHADQFAQGAATLSSAWKGQVPKPEADSIRREGEKK